MTAIRIVIVAGTLWLIGALAYSVVDAYATPQWLTQAFRCIQRHETGDAWTGRWRANTGNGYYGGLQMDRDFMLTYGREYVRLWGWANNWPIAIQIRVAIRAYSGYAGYGPRGFGPWPNTRGSCGL